MSVIDGKKIADDVGVRLKERVALLGRTPRLVIVQVGEDAASTQFVARKKQFGEAIGVEVRVHQYPVTVSTNEVRKRLAQITHEKETDGVVLQLPLPEGMNTDYLLAAIPVEKDVDVLSQKSVGAYSVGRIATTPPVVRSAQMLLEYAGVGAQGKPHVAQSALWGKNCVVVGAGRLVGRPLSTWLMREGAVVTVVGAPSDALADIVHNADFVFLGTGQVGIVHAHMLKAGAVVIDAGSGVGSDGKIAGDFDASGADEKDITYSPVPGGVGPLTVAVLFENLVILAEDRKKS